MTRQNHYVGIRWLMILSPNKANKICNFSMLFVEVTCEPISLMQMPKLSKTGLGT
jgi:hypothetical protein